MVLQQSTDKLHTHTHGEKPCEDGGKLDSAVISQGKLKLPANIRNKERTRKNPSSD